MATATASPRTPKTPSSSSALIETLLEQTARLQGKLESSLSTTNGLISRASKLKTRLHHTHSDSNILSKSTPPRALSSSLRGTHSHSADASSGGGDSRSPNASGGDGISTTGGGLTDALHDLTKSSPAFTRSPERDTSSAPQSSTKTSASDTSATDAPIPGHNSNISLHDQQRKIELLAAQVEFAQNQVVSRDQEIETLRAGMDTLERGLDEIMAKHHGQITTLQAERRSEYEEYQRKIAEEQQISAQLREQNTILQHKVHELVGVMREFADADVTGASEGEIYLSKLEFENKQLRELLQLSGVTIEDEEESGEKGNKA